MKIEVLGCSGGIGPGLKTTSFLVDDGLLVDAGTGVELLSKERMLKIRQVLISHAHLDHIAGLPLMLATIFDRHQHPVNVYALDSVIDALQQHVFNWTIWPDYTLLPETQPIVRLHPIQVGQTLQLGTHQIEVLPAEHPSPTAGYFIADHQSSFAFTGDTGINHGLWPIINRLQPQLLFIDVSFTDDMDELAKLSGHLTPLQLVQQLPQLKSPTKIMITHLKPGFEQAIMDSFSSMPSHSAPQKLHQGAVLEI